LRNLQLVLERLDAGISRQVRKAKNEYQTEDDLNDFRG
jgi:hypothetical protein